MKLIKTIKLKIRNAVNRWKFRRVCRKADLMHELTGRRYFVLIGLNRKFRIVCNSDILAYNKRAKKGDRIDIADLLQESLYVTAMGDLRRKGKK